MAVKHKNLYLYLAMVCFVGIILIFIFDGYVGIYDRLEIENGRFPQTIEADQWEEDRYAYMASFGVERGARVDFTYTVENHTFSRFTTDVQVSFLHNNEVIAEPIILNVSAPAFGEAAATWFVDAPALVPADYPSELNYDVKMVIWRAGVEREIIVNISPAPVKPVTIEPRPAG